MAVWKRWRWDILLNEQRLLTPRVRQDKKEDILGEEDESCFSMVMQGPQRKMRGPYGT